MPNLLRHTIAALFIQVGMAMAISEANQTATPPPPTTTANPTAPSAPPRTATPSTSPTSPGTQAVPLPSDASQLSDAAAFLLGSGLALLIALLAWGEQIRAITRDTRELERDFLDATGLSRASLSALLQARNDDDRLLAITNLMASEKLTSAPQVEVLPLFEQWRILGAKLRRLQSTKYWLTVSLTVVFLLTGTAVAFTRPESVGLSLILAIPATLVALILVTIISAGRVEQQLNALLMQMGEKV